MKKYIFLLVTAFTMLTLLVLFRWLFYIDGFSEWFVYFPIIPFIFSLISLFSEKISSNYRAIISMTAGLLFTLIVLSPYFSIVLVYQILSGLAGCGTAMAISYFVKK